MSRPTMYPGIVALDDHARSLEDKKGAYAAEAPYHGSCECDRRSQRCRRRKLLLLIPAVISLLAITAFLIFACFTESGSAVIRGAGLEGILLPRQTTGDSSSQGPFVGRKRTCAGVGLWVMRT